MRILALMILAAVALVGCGKKDDGNTGVVNPNKPSPKAVVFANTILEQLKKPTGELTTADLEKVRDLTLADNQLTRIPKELEKLTKLKRLDISYNQLTDVKGLEKLTQLEKLDLKYNQLTDVKGLEKLTMLTELGLYNLPDLTKVQIDELQKALPKCKIYSNPTK